MGTKELTFKVTENLSPADACEAMMGRQTGRTTHLILALPDDGHAAILIHRMRSKERLILMVRHLRPQFPHHNLIFVSDVEGLRGICRPVFVDNEVLDVRNMEFVRSLQQHC